MAFAFPTMNKDRSRFADISHTFRMTAAKRLLYIHDAAVEFAATISQTIHSMEALNIAKRPRDEN